MTRGPVTWFTSDPHFGHKFVAELRNCPDVETHDERIHEGLNQSLKSGDILYVLGDIDLSGRGDWSKHFSRIREVNELSAMHLIFGNHDAGWAGHRTSRKAQREYFDVFDSAQMYGQLGVNEDVFMLAHMPYFGDRRLYNNYRQWSPRDLGQPLLHGHTHSKIRLSMSPDGTPQIHVGIDAWDFSPVSAGQISTIMRSLGRNR